MLSARDVREFNGFLRQATDRQVQGIYDKEKRAGRDDYAELAIAEADRRGIVLDLIDDDEDEDHATMLQFPRWRVDVKVGGKVVKTLYETATTREAAINKAKHKMRGAVSSAGAFTFTAQRADDGDRAAHAAVKRKSPAQLDREIAEALSGSGHATVGGARSFLAPGVIRPGDRVTIVDRFGAQRTGRAVMRGPHGWVLNMGGRHGTPAVATDENIVSVKSPGLREAAKKTGHAAKKTGHATKRGAVPGVSKWNTYAGGTGAAEGKHSYDLHVPEGQYTIDPYTRSGGRHAGYVLRFAATGGRPRGTSGGLWHDLGTHRSPASAASAAAKHYARGFE